VVLSDFQRSVGAGMQPYATFSLSASP